MDKDIKKAKRFIIGLFTGCLCIALACCGFGVYVLLAKRGGEYVSDNMMLFSKPIFLVGIFFLVLAFGYLLPLLLSHNKRKQGESGASGIFSEVNMRKALEKYIPGGETLLAGIHAVANETSVTAVFRNCVRTENALVPHEDGGTTALNKRKYATYDIYFGITQHSFLITECERSSYYYEFKDGLSVRETEAQALESELLFEDIGKCFLLANIKDCEVKKGWMGSVKCSITMKNGDYFKLMFPKLGGLGGGMPHHAEYREKIIAQLDKGFLLS